MVAREWQYDGQKLRGIDIETKRQPENPRNFMHMFELVGMQTAYRPGDPYWFGDLPLELAPAILQTCKTIHDEAAPILYGQNAFYVSLPDLCTRTALDTTDPAEELRLRSQCLWLFGYREVAWPTLFFEMQASLFARFLHRIGKENAASLRTLRFVALDDDCVGYKDGPTIGKAMNVVFQLLHIHVPGLRDLSVILKVYDIRPYSNWFEIEEELKSDKESKGPYHHAWTPYPTVESVLYDILRNAVPKLLGLRYLDFKGFERDPYVKRELEKFEIVDGCRKGQVASCNRTTS